jgi:hypothetical protein
MNTPETAVPIEVLRRRSTRSFRSCSLRGIWKMRGSSVRSSVR